MSNYLETTKELTAYLSAVTPLIVVHTEERGRAQGALTEAARELNVDIDFYTECDQFVELRRGERSQDVGGEPLSFIEETLKKKTHCVFALGDVRFLDADNSFSRRTANIVRLAAERKSTVVIVTADFVWQPLAKLGMHITLELPTQKEREKTIRFYINRNKIKNFGDELISKAATMLSGYTSLQLKTILNYSGKLEGGFSYDRLCEIAMQKDKIFGAVPSISRIRVGDVHVAGLDGVKEWLKSKQKIFFAPKEELDKKHISSPKGVLLAGVPGCGKSLSARLIAKEWQLPLYRFDIGALFDKYVGESERNMRLALEYVDSVSPCVLWIDEIEKELSSGGDNDTAKRMLGAFLYWLQEYRGRVFLIATANDISLMPPELFRKGRLSEIFFVDLPEESERRSAIELYIGLCLDGKFTPGEVDELARISDGFSYADIEAAIKSVAEKEYRQNVKEGFDAVKTAFTSAVSILSAQSEKIAKARKWGEESAVPASGKRR